MITRSSVIVPFCLCGFAASAQYEPDTILRLPLICDVFVLASGQAESMYSVGIEQWRELAPNSELLARDLSDYTYYNQGYGEYAHSVGCAMSISLRLGGQGSIDRSGAYLRAGFAYQNHVGNDLLLRKQVRTPFDTLSSSQTGQLTYIDSLTISTYALGHSYRQLGLDASLIFLKEYPAIGRYTVAVERRWVWLSMAVWISRIWSSVGWIQRWSVPRVRGVLNPRIPTNSRRSARRTTCAWPCTPRSG